MLNNFGQDTMSGRKNWQILCKILDVEKIFFGKKITLIWYDAEGVNGTEISYKVFFKYLFYSLRFYKVIFCIRSKENNLPF